MTRIVRNVLLVLILAGVLIFLGGAVLDWLGNGTSDQPGYVELVWLAWDAGALLLVIAVVWFWRRYQRRRS
jgi:membrane protein implicated in regulation of membrane protease activity